jgi:hypothetical protein
MVSIPGQYELTAINCKKCNCGQSTESVAAVQILSVADGATALGDSGPNARSFVCSQLSTGNLARVDSVLDSRMIGYRFIGLDGRKPQDGYS